MAGSDTETPPQWPCGDTAMATRIRRFDWSATALGPIEGWPQSLRTVVDFMLASPGMTSLLWGAGAIHLYNDAFAELLREHDAPALGRSAFETFARSRDVFAADVAAGMAGKAARLTEQRYPVLRDGQLKDAWFDVDYAPVRDEGGAVAGVLWTLRETTTQVLAARALQESEARHRLLIGSWAQAVWETSPEGVVVVDSPSWRAFTGQTEDEWLGYGWLDAIHPDDRAYAERQWREAIAARGLVDAEFRLRAPDGGWRWTNVRASPVLDADGAIAKWIGINIDIDARRRVETALRESEAIRRVALDSGRMGAWTWDTRAGTVRTDATVQALWGVSSPEQPHPVSIYADLMFLEGVDWFRSVAAQGFPPGGEFQVQVQVAAGPAAGRWVEMRGRAEREKPWIINGVSFDITPRRQIEERIRASEERLRVLVEGIPQLVWRSLDGGNWTWSSVQWQSFTGQGPESSLGRGWLDAVHPDDHAVALRAWHDADAAGGIDVEFRVRRGGDGAYLWHHTRSMPVRDSSGRIVEWLGTTTDVQQRKELQERQAVLVDELQHRTRNLIGVVRSVADKTARSSADLNDFRARFRDRLDALARVQGLLSRLDEADRVSFDDLIRTELSAVSGSLDRAHLAGPSGVRLRSSTVQMLAMALHELATNAVKYGAFKQPGGQLAVTWSLDRAEDGGRPWLHIDWRESGVTIAPEGTRPTGTGQGRELIERALPYQLRARTSYQLKPDGVHCTISIPVSASTEVPEHA
ncbi:PAS domain S-box-containing protein [Sphingomonas sp. BE138]|uniref:PAS domain-containing sensor histidine kinase n=1 Tax=Sphingomonas sp. BE138 TaxID=2817845 RepID=UPI00285E9C6C|nr:PAS domain-containing protein [Sphingomonas sp. BE138]MDR6787138.1 PAS domain S-box-containing protein [Sphingomonas sp. BE138]